MNKDLLVLRDEDRTSIAAIMHRYLAQIKSMGPIRDIDVKVKGDGRDGLVSCFTGLTPEGNAILMRAHRESGLPLSLEPCG
ncbi:hypothetical protein ADL19_19285 [Streptomyces purpurogeneiscleroticus]|nr:hypothetical protein ADL19_19285 [Streptomyces purpurogeneiscleroticus]